MRRGFLSSVTALLAGTSLALAQPPATPDPAAAVAPNGTGQPAAVGLPPGPAAPVVDEPRSPYWPSPPGAPVVDRPASPYWPDAVGKTQCAAPACMVPQAPHDDRALGQFFVWGSAEYLLWWVKNQPLSVPLVTTSTSGTGTGTLGSADTAVISGGSGIDYHTFSGARFTLGFGVGQSCDDIWGLEGSGFFTERRTSRLVANSSATGAPVLARPIVDALTNTETVAIVSEPGLTSGIVDVASNSAIYGWDVNVIRSAYRGGPLHIDLLGGFRYLNLSEDLAIGQSSTPVGGTIIGLGGNVLLPPANSVVVFDNFATRNEFYSGQLGARVEYAGERFVLSGLVKVALGDSHEVVGLGGFTSRSGTGTVPGVTPGGLLVVSSNSGQHSHDAFAVVPEVGLNVGYQVNKVFRVFMGYTFLYWSDVVRPGDQINRTVNPNLVPISPTFRTTTVGPAQPSFSFQRTDFWAQGLNLGMEFRF
jgi:Putative beta barrel porin-7 (BBP7)